MQQEQDTIKITETQNKYLMQLAKGPKTTNELMRELMVSMSAAGRMIQNLKKAELVESTPLRTKGNVNIHKLVTPYQELVKKGLIITANHIKGMPIRDSEILYAAILRNGGLTGQRLSGQYCKTFPERNAGAIKNIVLKARKQGLCR